LLLKFYRLYLSRHRKYNKRIFWTFGIVPGRPELYKEAFSHQSLRKYIKNSKKKISNERLEYLGDAVLDLVVAEELYKKYPFRDEGFLTEMRSKIVSRQQLSALGKRIGIQPFIDFSRDLKPNPQGFSIMIGNAFEAFIGAVYMDKGYKPAKKYIKDRILDRFINFDDLIKMEISYKSRLYKWSQQQKKELSIELMHSEEKGRGFIHTMGVKVDGKLIAEAISYSKKKAEEQACQRVCEELSI
jgi:ribonuclease-3